MNYFFKTYFSKQLQRITYGLILTSILSLSTSVILQQAATANPKNPTAAECGQYQNQVMNNQSDRTDSLPNSVANAVRQDLARKLNISADNFKIINYSQETWSDGCLGLAQADEFCTQALVEGWRVTLSNQRQTWVYRTDRQGKVIRLDQSNSANSKSVPINNNSLKPIQIPTSQLPPPLQPGVVFRAIASGGITGRTYETSLLDDGLLIKVAINPNGTTLPTQQSQISQQQLQRFQQLLNQVQFSQFDGLSYLAPTGAADYITYTLISPSGTTVYTDIDQSRLPQGLVSVIQAWNAIAIEAQ